MSRGRNQRDSRSLLARAGMRTADGASVLFGRLDALNSQDDPQPEPPRYEREREQAAALFTHLAERLRAGAWNEEIAELAIRAAALERALAAAESAE